MSTLSNSALLQPEADSTDEQMVNEMESLVAERQRKRLSRRGFLAGASLAGAAGLAGCSNGSNNTGTTTPPPNGTPPTVSDILNFALNLEYLEATFYLTVTTGAGLQPADMGAKPGAVTGGQGKINFQNAAVLAAAITLAADEQAHVQFLRATMTSLGLTPVDMPALNLSALNMGGTAITTDAQFVALARQFEATGVSAYAGASIGLISNTAALEYAAPILATASQHESLLRQLCVLLQVSSPAVDSNDTVPYVAATATAAATINAFNTSTTTGLYTARNTSQVLMIVYGSTAAGTVKGGFYPNGLNGNIIST